MNEILTFICGAFVSTGSVFLFMYFQKRSIKEANEFNLKSQIEIMKQNAITGSMMNESTIPILKEQNIAARILAEREFESNSHSEKMRGLEE